MDYHSPQWFLRTEAILCAIIVITVLACLGFCLMISIKLFQNTEVQLNGKYKSIQFAVEKQAGGRVDDLSIPAVEETDVTKETLPIEHIPREEEDQTNQNKLSPGKTKTPEIEVIDLMKEEVMMPMGGQKSSETDTVKTESQVLSNDKIEAEKQKKFPAEVMKKPRSVKTKNQNPLTVAAKPAKMSKVKVRTPINRKPSPQSLDYPDDPKFRGKIDYPDNSDYPSSFRGEKPEEVNPAYSSQ